MINSSKIFEKYTSEECFKSIINYGTVVRLWSHSVSAYGSNIAIVDGQNYTYDDVESLVASYRTVLLDAGLAKGDRIGICLPNGIDFAKAVLAASTLGICSLLIPPQLSDAAVAGCCLKYQLKALVSGRNPDNPKPSCPVISEKASSDIKTGPDLSITGKTPCVIMFTGGTTGKSKGALLTHEAVVLGTRNGCYGLKNFLEERYFLMLPMTHVFGFIRNFMTALMTGSSVWICHNNKDMFKEMLTFRPTVLVLVPAIVEMALNLSRQFGRNMFGDSVKYIICGAATVNPYLVKECGRIGISLFPGYGLTESANLVSGNPDSNVCPGSVGYIYPDIDYKVVDGELWLKGPSITEGYCSEPEENSTAFEDGWFKTGDLVTFDSENRLYITGRRKEIIVLPTGENISPAQLEARFNELECIQDSLVYEKNGRLVLEVVPRKAAIPAGVNPAAYIREGFAGVNMNLPAGQKISEIVIRTTDFARSPSMKILRNQPK